MILLDYFEDISLNVREEIGRHRFSADEIKSFARRYDPQPFHLDEEAARRSHFGALCASGWHSAVMWLTCMVRRRQSVAVERQARGEATPAFGPSPGFRDLKWPKAVYAGDTITYACEVVDKRASASRPQWGIVTMHNTGTNQAGELVMSHTGFAFIERHPAGTR